MPRKEDEPLTDEELSAIEQAATGYVIGGIVERSGAGPDNTLRLVAEVRRHRTRYIAETELSKRYFLENREL